jgi:hypothetical protein
MGITAINGIAITASLASTATTALSASTGLVTTNAVHFPIFVDANNLTPASEKLGTIAGYNFNPGTTRLELTGSLFATTITGSLLGTASFAVTSSRAINANTASRAVQVETVAIATNANFFPTFVDANNGSAGIETLNTDGTYIYNPSTNELRADLINNNTGGSKTSTADGNLTIDASLTQSMYWVASFTATRSLVVNNISQGRQVRVYIRNTNATQRQIIFSGSTTTSGHALINMAVNAGAASVTTQNIVANNGTMLATIENIGGFIVGGLM